MQISIVGCGKLGLPMAAFYASKWHRVTAIDNNDSIICSLRDGKCTTKEPLLENLLHKSKDRITFTSDYSGTALADICFVIVPTPTDESGEFNNSYILKALPLIKSPVIVIVSTVKLGSMREFAKLTNSKLLYNPEFVALGSVIDNMAQPDALLIGEDDKDKSAGDKLVEFYQKTYDKLPSIHRMTWENAEVAKMSLNVAVTMKISLANTLTEICHNIRGGNIDAVTAFVGADSRIGSKYLKGGLSFSGTCFPRDNRAFAKMSSRIGIKGNIQYTIDMYNQKHQDFVIDEILEIVGKETDRISILGLAYKINTPVTEESPALRMIDRLAGSGYDVIVYDPLAKVGNVKQADTIEECLKDSDLAIITTQEPMFKRLPVELMRNPIIFDCWRWIDKSELNKNVKYYALGIGK